MGGWVEWRPWVGRRGRWTRVAVEWVGRWRPCVGRLGHSRGQLDSTCSEFLCQAHCKNLSARLPPLVKGRRSKWSKCQGYLLVCPLVCLLASEGSGVEGSRVEGSRVEGPRVEGSRVEVSRVQSDWAFDDDNDDGVYIHIWRGLGSMPPQRKFSESARARYEDDPQAAAVGPNQWHLNMGHVDLMTDMVYRASCEFDVDVFLRPYLAWNCKSWWRICNMIEKVP